MSSPPDPVRSGKKRRAAAQEPPAEKRQKDAGGKSRRLKEKTNTAPAPQTEKAPANPTPPVVVASSAAAPEDDDGMFVPFDLPARQRKPAKSQEQDAAAKPKSEKDLRREKWEKRQEQEKEVDLAEEAREADPSPKTADGFKMLLASNPNSSFAWCQFMAFWLARGEASKARQVAELALQSISCREEQEIYNVWAAYLTLESQHGTNESLHAVFKRAIQNVDQEKRLWYYTIDLLYKGEKYGRVQHMYREMLRKFKGDVDVWAAFYRWCVRFRKHDELKRIPHNALVCLAKDQHVNMMTRFAAIDMREGNMNRGRMILEGLVAKVPRRGDVWSVYVDMEKVAMNRGKSSPRQVRALFERVITLKFSPKTMQGFFTRYMNFEREFGDEASQAVVMEKATRYVEDKCATSRESAY